MRNTLLFPYYGEYIPMFALGNDYVISEVVTLAGSGFEGKDVGSAIMLPEQGMTVGTDFDTALGKCDVLLITESGDEEVICEHIKDAVRKAVYAQKEIVSARVLPQELIEEITVSNLPFTYLPEHSNVILEPDTNSLQELGVPVIAVGGLFGFADEFEVLTSLVKAFRDKGLRVSGVGCSNYCPLFDLHTLPDFMLPKHLDDDDRVLMFNYYLAQIEKEERPDLIFVQLPKGMIKYSDEIPNSFGVLPFIISQSVNVDIFICCSIFDGFPIKFWTSISKFIENRFGFKIDCVHMSTTSIFQPETNEDKKISTFKVPLSVVSQALFPDGDIPVVNALTEEGLNKIVSYIENTLS